MFQCSAAQGNAVAQAKVNEIHEVLDPRETACTKTTRIG